MTLVGAGLHFALAETTSKNVIIHGYNVVTVKGATLAIGGTIKAGELGDGAAGVWR